MKSGQLKKLFAGDSEINSIDAALDENNYAPLKLPDKVETYNVVNKRAINSGEKNLSWTNLPPPDVAMNAVENDHNNHKEINTNVTNKIDCW